jgi:NOL1/NOP2/fmu family ribosome biogenesis protein
MRIEVLSRARRKAILEEFGKFGVSDVDETLIMTGSEKIRAFSGDLDREEIMALWRVLPVEGIGLYVGKDSFNRKRNSHEVRLTLDGLHVWKDRVEDRIVDLDEGQEREWFLGRDVELREDQKVENGFVVVKAGVDFVGVGKVGNEGTMLFGFLPKERRRRERSS